MTLDIRTTIMIAAALALMMGLSLRFVLSDYPAAMSASIRLWTLGTLLQPTAWVMYGLRGAIPDLLSVVLANTLLTFAFAKQIEGLRLFLARPRNATLIYAPVVAMALCEITFTYVMPSLRGRVLTGSAAVLAQMVIAVAAMSDWGQLRRRSHLLTAAAFFSLAVVLTSRIVYEGLRSETLESAFSTSPMQTLVFAFATFFPTIATLGFVLMCGDRLQRELEHQATIDALTGVSNRRTLGQYAANAIALAHRHSRPLAVLLIDADHFKRINDAYGHEAGDEALRVLAATVQSGLRGEDLFARLGGEEFVAVLPESDEAAALASAERLRAEVEQAVCTAQDARIPLRVSIGVAVIQAHDDFARLLRRADLAMYAAKRAGGNRICGPAVAQAAGADALTG